MQSIRILDKSAFTALVLLFALMVASGRAEVLFREDFNTLDNWKPLYFPKIPRHTSYTIVSEGDGKCLRAESNASASGIVYNKTFKVYEYPRVHWRWKVESIYKNGNARTKVGDDYPIRVYILFQYDPSKAGFFDRAKYNAARRRYGEYPPHSTLNYIWANRKHETTVITNSYSKQSKMILLQQGKANIGKWMEEEVHILRDYRKAYGESAPAVASIAIMNDSDNTGEKSVSYIDYIEVHE